MNGCSYTFNVQDLFVSKWWMSGKLYFLCWDLKIKWVDSNWSLCLWISLNGRMSYAKFVNYLFFYHLWSRWRNSWLEATTTVCLTIGMELSCLVSMRECHQHFQIYVHYILEYALLHVMNGSNEPNSRSVSTKLFYDDKSQKSSLHKSISWSNNNCATRVSS